MKPNAQDMTIAIYCAYDVELIAGDHDDQVYQRLVVVKPQHVSDEIYDVNDEIYAQPYKTQYRRHERQYIAHNKLR